MIFTATDVSSLATSLEHWEWAEYASCALVALGCIGEYTAEFTNYWTDGLKERKDRLAKRSTLLLISALALELMCLVKTNSISGMLIGSLSDEAGAAETKARSAIDKSSLAERKADAAVASASSATTSADNAGIAAGTAQKKVEAVAKRAEDIDFSLGMTQYAMSERYVTDQKSLVSQLRQFKGQPVYIASYETGEGYFFCDALSFFAGSAEMNVTNGCERVPPSIPPATGVSISGPDIQQTLALSQILLHTASLGPSGISSAIKGPTLTIFVGVKTPFVSGQARGVKVPPRKQTKQGARP
jgi:hypothetical protein